MTILVPDRVLQTTQTIGTGAYTLIPASGAFRNFRDAYSNNAHVPYCVSDNAFNYEIGIGSLIIGSPDQLIRSNVLLSSNSNSFVNWPGTTKQVFAWEVSGSAYCVTFAGSVGLTLADWGTSFIFTGGSTSGFMLPPLASVPLGFTVRIKNSGTANCNATPQSLDQIETYGTGASYTHPPGGFGTYASDLTVWRQIDIGSSVVAIPPVTRNVISSGTSNTLSTLSAVETQQIWRSATGGAKTQNIPAAASFGGYKLGIALIGGVDSLTITPATGTIGGAASITLTNPGQTNLSLLGDNANTDWIIL